MSLDDDIEQAWLGDYPEDEYPEDDLGEYTLEDLENSIPYYSMWRNILDRYGRPGILRMVSILTVMEDVENEINKKELKKQNT